MKKFEFQKTYEEFEIAGKVYKVDFSDPAVKRYQLELHKYMEEAKRLEKVDIQSLDPKGQEKAFNDAIDAIRQFIDCVMGEGSFDELYKASGESSENMADLVAFLGEVIGEKVKKLKEKAKKYKYTKRKGK